MPPEKRSGQVWVGVCLESLDSPWCKNMQTQFGGQMDWAATYMPNADVPAYFVVPTPDELRKEVPEKPEAEVASLLMSSCAHSAEQMEYLTELMKFMDVASYGKCFHNKEIPPATGLAPHDHVHQHSQYAHSMTPEVRPRKNDSPLPPPPLFAARRSYFSPCPQVYQAIGRHKFFLAFERSDDAYYHTEKFWAGFAAGSVPVYWGSSTVLSGNYGPAKNSFVYVPSFPDPRTLAKYLTMLAKDDDLYDRFFEWKNETLSRQYFQHKANDASNLACNICRKVAGSIK